MMKVPGNHCRFGDGQDARAAAEAETAIAAETAAATKQGLIWTSALAVEDPSSRAHPPWPANHRWLDRHEST